MSQELITYSAQKVKIKALRGQRFELSVSVKNSDGSDYDFTTTLNFGDGSTSTLSDGGYFQVFGSGGTPLSNAYTGQTLTEPDYIDFEVTVEDGKLTIANIDSVGFWPSPGTYKYSLFTERASSENSELDYWLHGDFVVIDDNPATNLGGIPTTGGLSA